MQNTNETEATLVEISDQAWAQAIAETYDWEARRITRECEQLALEMIEFFGPSIGSM